MTQKLALIQELVAQRDEILKWYDAMDDALRQTPFADGQWNAQDVVGHLSSSEGDTLDQLAQTFREGRPRPMPPDTTVDAMNSREASKRKEWSWERLRAEFENTRNALIQRVDQMSETDLQFYVPSPWVNDGRIITLETLIREDVLQHGAEHLRELRQWRQTHDECCG